ncbi:aldolase [Dichomitus squalens LYAD-421 SS1]|uniref:aldolase n=1 Tax=Dichomitus squalens (strain LYAD-421) TaxID=732165 RepID=UPI0004413B6F|nr:aldolase [Dichomitus squalens LYAD-421 SS1]EJF66699.1 aldolase [Dichomitus squalens LYAD-421 SS1]
MSLPSSLLSYVRSRVIVDVDSMDPAVAARHTAGDGARFCDMTSNQAIVYGEVARPDRAELLEKACAQVRSSEAELDIEAQVSDAIDLLTVLLAKEVYPYLTGRVHAQTSPSTAYNTEATIQHAKKLVSVFDANGIPKSRVCIKIPATPESTIACQYLERLGIRTLSTCLFSVAQAIAAHQAGCLYIAPYFNELRVHFEPGVWKEYADTAKEHPASRVISSIVRLYKEIGASTLVMPASIVTSKEVLALVSLKPDHLTLSGAVLDQLAAAQSTDTVDQDPKPHHPEVGLESGPATSDGSDALEEPDVKATNFLENGGAALREAIAADAETTRKLADALKIFGEMEAKTKELIRAKLQSQFS